ncbi:hypothetical protein KK083_27795 [Fulvivirgaceae bacterium PWU4]|uniref:DUF4468 domain-containing protein n=1 Tax=Chryseosolibacter histidini TaxID=2782349 RepID=A0AAP2DQK0_9BACT|nr:hypothetical protein [Chryseosolibacter histidini]MBT1700725.1 hypothetical protein [Chryseosolibacter histidini]
MRKVYGVLLVVMLMSHLAEAQPRSDKKLKKTVYEEVDFEDMMRRYFGKEKSDPLEGIYSVSCVIVKRNKRFLSKREKITIVERKDNYARIAILRDWPSSTRDYLEVSLSYRDAKKYPVVGELSVLAEGKTFIYKHIEPNGTSISFSMVNESAEMLEAEYSEMERRKTITYKLSYLKTYPKTSDLTVYNDK